MLFPPRFRVSVSSTLTPRDTSSPAPPMKDVRSDLRPHKMINRWVWEHPPANSTQLSVAKGVGVAAEWKISEGPCARHDPLGVSHVDLLGRTIDAFSGLLRELLFETAWDWDCDSDT